jgi:uncharacterized protein YbgA (DUF1722 family)/uncharacterized protein YbbK (DUF523 family)
LRVETPVVRVGISRCLLGDEVRFDGGHKHDPFLTATLGRYFDWVPVCPEVDIGLGVPRESIRLVEKNSGLCLQGVRSRNDVTDRMQRYCRQKTQELSACRLHGFIFKKDSPSCGMERVRVHNEAGGVVGRGSGMFAAAVIYRFPLLPVEEEGRLNDPILRENFVERVFSYFRWTELLDSAPDPGGLVSFHTHHKCALLSHDEPSYRELGRIVAQAGRKDFRTRLDRYGVLFMTALKKKATPRKHSNVLYHLLGFLKDHLDAADKQEIVDCIEEYRSERLPLIVPLTLLNHHFRKRPVPWVMEQTYLNPYPSELMLRNHV